jgi:glycosyltransferase involved in cell wall biosynthesis
MKRPIKILLVSHSNYMGGAELCFVELLRVLNKSGRYELHAVFPLHEGSLVELCREYCEDSYMHFLPRWIDEGKKYPLVEKLRRLTGLFSSSRKAYRLIKQVNPDIVITNTSVIPEFAFAARIAKKKHIWFIHELVDEDFGCHFIYGKRWSKKLIGYLSAKVITNSKFVNSRYESLVDHEKLVMLYQPVEIRVEEKQELKLKAQQEQLELLIIGKVCDFKGQHEAILACNELYRRGVHFHLSVVGLAEQSYVELLQGLMLKEVRSLVEFVAFSNQPELYYQRANIVLICSRCEALGRVTIEAMKTGLPIVGSNRGGNMELIQDGVNGYLYEYGNPIDLADKVLMLNDADRRKLMGEAGKAMAEKNFNMLTFGRTLIQLVELCVR